MNKSIAKHGGLLALFALIATALVAATHALTKDKIAQQIQQQRLALLNTVVPKTFYDNDLAQTCVTLSDPVLGGMQTIYIAKRNDVATAFAIETTATNGYSGDIDMIVGVSVEAQVLGVRVLNHKETPGLGDKIELAVSDWILSFNGKTYSDSTAPLWKVKKDGGQFDQFTGATITPRAVVGTVADTLNWLVENQDSLLDSEHSCVADNTLQTRGRIAMSDSVSLRNLLNDGLWKNNPALVQLLGLCPLLAVTSTLINGLGLGLATLIVLVGSNVTVSCVRHYVPNEIRIPVFVMIIAAYVTVVELLMNAFTYNLYLALGIFIPLIVTNCAIIGRAEAFASKQKVLLSAFDGLMMGAGFAAVLMLLGGMREILGAGTLFAGADRLFGELAAGWTITLFESENAFLLAILPPGAFLGMGLIIAMKNHIDHIVERNATQQQAPAVQRARVTTDSV